MKAVKREDSSMKNRFLLMAVGFAFLLSGCVTNGKQGCMEEWQARYPTYTRNERLVLFQGAKGVGCIQEWFYEVERSQDGQTVGIPRIAYHKIKLNQVLAVEKKQLKDAEEILDTNPKNEEWYKIVEEMGVRSYFEAQERALRFRVARLQLTAVHNEFRKLLGEIDTSSEAEKRRSGYNVRIFLPEFDPERDASFRAKFLEEAKRNGKLFFIGMTTVFDFESFGKKDPDPEFPNDPNRFIWKEKAEGLEVRLYKVMNHTSPRENQAHYLEATRLIHRFDKTGNLVATDRESKPALRIFASPSDALDIVVMDTDREGDLGFGLPDIVEKLYSGISSGKELYLNHQTLLAKLFQERVAEKRKLLSKPDSQKLEIAEVGTPVDPWEKATTPKGWLVPHDYQSEKKDNYQLEVIFKPRKSEDYNLPRHIDFITKVYHSAASTWMPVKGEVVEYFRPLPEFAEKNILEARVDWSNRKRITFEREGQPSISGIVNPGKNLFIGERPSAIEFSDGATRWLIADRDKSGVFMYRREVARGGQSAPVTSSESEY